MAKQLKNVVERVTVEARSAGSEEVLLLAPAALEAPVARFAHARPWSSAPPSVWSYTLKTNDVSVKGPCERLRGNAVLTML